jgi:hypothetical protein
MPKPDNDITRKLQSNIALEIKCKFWQQNISTLNPTMYRKLYITTTQDFFFHYATHATQTQHFKVVM